MRYEDKAKKSKRPKNNIITAPASTVADIVGCSPITVKSVRNGKRSESTELGKKIQLADILLQQGTSHLITEIKKIIRL